MNVSDRLVRIVARVQRQVKTGAKFDDAKALKQAQKAVDAMLKAAEDFRKSASRQVQALGKTVDMADSGDLTLNIRELHSEFADMVRQFTSDTMALARLSKDKLSE